MFWSTLSLFLMHRFHLYVQYTSTYIYSPWISHSSGNKYSFLTKNNKNESVGVLRAWCWRSTSQPSILPKTREGWKQRELNTIFFFLKGFSNWIEFWSWNFYNEISYIMAQTEKKHNKLSALHAYNKIQERNWTNSNQKGDLQNLNLE